MTDIEELGRRAAEATTGSRKLDGEIWHALDGHVGVWAKMTSGVWHRQDPNDTVAYEPPQPFTRSVDAALALVERMLPGCGWNVGFDARREVVATIWWDGTAEVEAYGATAPLAILAALLSALPSTKDISI